MIVHPRIAKKQITFTDPIICLFYIYCEMSDILTGLTNYSTSDDVRTSVPYVDRTLTKCVEM